jgi:cytochrome c oxidase subunit II
VRRSLFLVVTLVAGALALSAAAAASNGGISPVEPVSPNGQRISDAYWLVLAVTGAVFLVVETVLVVFVIRYRRRGRPRALEPTQVAGNTRIEVAWTVVPVILLAAIVSFVFYKLPGIKNTPPASAAGGELKYTVEAHQFYWLFKDANGHETINYLVVPVNRVVSLDVVSADVAHSWWVPAFGGKIDAIPGKTNHTWFKADKTGTYPIRCAEFCGIQHTGMKGFVQVVNRVPTAQPAHPGKAVFLGVCASCHGSAGEGLVGPAIAASATLGDRKALRTIVKNGVGKMPAVGRTWNDQLINALAGYVKTRFAGQAQAATTGGSGG